ncbi:hypothetical protein [Brevibacillus borstelensis]|uniref:hypothetical protein n=1 Tax=Brevibacillus borstelensis TaxID=45462 RepID=UPI00046A9AA5|nr:hypothetical protein [Brevibacillus borstelensis]MCC0566550.1 hypothetical protein [Brevibacillus borstelensis]MCM3473054.1 hypothetical protein [Brevibacillus borstelensis]MCM3561680.1 hypothetical protein [Brevibacillus borstelensis]MED1852982.1 hypothetical protein [Brevibacillus borstelensis]
MKQARALLAEAQRLQALISDDDRLYKEFSRQSGLIAGTFKDFEDEFRKRWHSLKPTRPESKPDATGQMPRASSVDPGSRERLLCARYLSIAADLRISIVVLRGAVRYGNAATIDVKRAEIRQAVRQLAGLIRDGVGGEPDEQVRTVEVLI